MWNNPCADIVFEEDTVDGGRSQQCPVGHHEGVAHKERQEPAQIVGADAVVNPCAVVVMPSDTCPADRAVDRARRPQMATRLAVLGQKQAIIGGVQAQPGIYILACDLPRIRQEAYEPRESAEEDCGRACPPAPQISSSTVHPHLSCNSHVAVHACFVLVCRLDRSGKSGEAPVPGWRHWRRQMRKHL